MRKLTWALLAAIPTFLPTLSFSQPLFNPPANLGPKINSPFYESDPFWDGPRKRLYFVKAGPTTISLSEDIWYADWTDTGWTDPKPVGGGINTEEIEHSPSVSPDGQKLYYVGFARSGWPDVWDVWVSNWDSNLNDWGPPTNVGCPISTSGVEYSAKIAPDGRTLYFYSTQSTCDTMTPWYSGLVSSVYDFISGWSPPQSLGTNVNALGGEQYPSATADGMWLFFRRPLVSGNIIVVSPWTGSGWGPAIDLSNQVGGEADAPSVTSSGDSLFLASFFLGGFGNSDVFVVNEMSTGINDEDEAGLPRDFELHQNYPNPFNGETFIPLFVSVSIKGAISFTVYNILGQPIRHLLKDEKITGKTIKVWDGRDNFGKEVGSGIYLYELRVGNQRTVKKMLLLR